MKQTKRDALSVLRNILANIGKVGLVQVPHHASQNNHNIHLYHPGQICFASVYDSNDCSYSIDVRNEIESLSSSFIKITEKSAPFVEEISLYV